LVGLNLGEMEVESEIGRGSTFSFTLPLWNPAGLAERFFHRLEQIGTSPQSAALLVATIEPTLDRGTRKVVDEFLHHELNSNDLAIGVAPSRWLLLVQCQPARAGDWVQRIRDAAGQMNRDWPAMDFPALDLDVLGGWPLAQKQAALDAFHEAFHQPVPAPTVRRVLVADDDPETLRCVSIRLRAAGYSVLTAKDGTAAVQQAVEHRPHAILLDNCMPGKTGLEALDDLASQPATAGIPVVMMSAGAGTRHEALRRGARLFLRKPGDMRKILNALQDVTTDNSTPGAPS
jgi:CheY-like chemotaxis protein